MPKRKKSEIWMELLNMERIKVRLEQLYLDPNNPRFETPGKEKVPENRISEKTVQEHWLQVIHKEGIQDLTESIRTSGFWTVDRIVLRVLAPNKYVVVEGNRRTAALKTLLNAHQAGKINLPQTILKSICEFEALLYKGENPDIAWIVQGFRHTPGIKAWERYPKAKFLAEIEKSSSRKPQEIAQIFGITPAKGVTHLIRSYYGFEDAKNDEEYGDILEPNKFGMFDEVIFPKAQIKEWLGWSDQKRKFTNKENLRKILSWMGEKKIDISPTTRDTLQKLVQPEYREIMDRFENGELDIRECKDQITKDETLRATLHLPDVISSLKKIKNMINTLPVPSIQRVKAGEEKAQKQEIIKLLKELSEIISLQIKNLTGRTR